MNTAFFIDDTGSPGQVTNSRYLRDDRKTWVGVLFTPRQRIYAQNQMKDCIDFISESLGYEEFHFVEIYGNKTIDIETRLGIFRAFSEIYSEYRWPILVQTFNPDSMIEHKTVMDITVDKFDLRNHEDLALLFLLFRLKHYVSENSSIYSLPIDIIIDEGRQNAGTYETISLLENIASGSRVRYAKSLEESLIQLTDFAAYCLNRMQILAIKENRTEADNTFLQICSDANFNFVNLELVSFNLEKLKLDEYDYMQYLDKASKGLPTLSELENMKRVNNFMRSYKNRRK